MKHPESFLFALVSSSVCQSSTYSTFLTIILASKNKPKLNKNKPEEVMSFTFYCHKIQWYIFFKITMQPFWFLIRSEFLRGSHVMIYADNRWIFMGCLFLFTSRDFYSPDIGTSHGYKPHGVMYCVLPCLKPK